MESDTHATIETAASRERFAWYGLLALALAPFVVGLIAVTFGDYHPVSDVALVELRVRDVFTGDVSLVGPYSRFGWNHPGPALFVGLAIPYVLTGQSSSALLAGALLFNAAAVTGIAVVARRRGGIVGTAWLLLVTSVLALALGGEVIRSPWNPYVTVLGFLLFCLLAWSVTDLDVWAAPFAVGLGSVIVQTHVSYALVVAVLGSAALAVAVVRTRRIDLARGGVAARSRLRRSVLASLVVAAVLWAAPVAEELTRDGNLSAIARFFTGDQSTAGFGVAIDTVSTGLAPWAAWLGASESINPFNGQLSSSGTPWFLVTLAALGAAAAFAVRRAPTGSAARLCGIAGLAIGVSLVAVARIVDGVLPYLVRWLWGVAALTAAAIGWAVWDSLSKATRRQSRRPLVGVLAVGLAGVALGGVVSAARADDPFANPVVAQLADQIVASDRIAAGATVVVTGMNPGVGLELERRGLDIVYPAADATRVGEHRIDALADVELLVVADGAVAEAVADATWEPVAFVDALSAAERAAAERLVRAHIEVQADLYEPGYLVVLSEQRVDEVADVDRGEVADAIEALKQRRFGVFLRPA